MVAVILVIFQPPPCCAGFVLCRMKDDQIIADKFPGNRNDHSDKYVFFIRREIARGNRVILNPQPSIYHCLKMNFRYCD